MYKLAILATLGFAASAQFLSNTRDLQGYNGTVNATAFASTCTATAAGTTDSCPATYCCAALRRATPPAATWTPVTTAATVCAPVEWNASNFTISGAVNQWNCINTVNVNTFRNATASRKACGNDTDCDVGSCCATLTDFFATSATTNATVTTRKFCLDGTKGGVQLWGTYAAANVGAGAYASISQGSCTNNVPASFGAYIKASLMMVAAVLSVAFF
jgi:hypothetical protein